MKLKEINAKNSGGTRIGKCSININRKGPFSISKKATETLNVKSNDLVQIVIDEAGDKDFYLEKVHADGFEVRTFDTSTMFNNAKAANMILDAFEIPATSASFLISTTPVVFQGRKLYLIIASTAKYNDKKVS